MPLVKKIIHDNLTEIFVWKIDEKNDVYLKELVLSEKDLQFLDELNKKRKREWLASRYVLQKCLKININEFVKDRYGKPFLKQKESHISISHSHDYTAIISSPCIVGIDIQLAIEKITSIAPKFLNEMETDYTNKESDLLPYLHTIWGAKESIYKAYGRKEIDFKKEMNINLFKYSKRPFHFRGTFDKVGNVNYDLYSHTIKDYHLVYCILADSV